MSDTELTPVGHTNFAARLSILEHKVNKILSILEIQSSPRAKRLSIRRSVLPYCRDKDNIAYTFNPALIEIIKTECFTTEDEITGLTPRAISLKELSALLNLVNGTNITTKQNMSVIRSLVPEIIVRTVRLEKKSAIKPSVAKCLLCKDPLKEKIEKLIQ